MEELCEEGMDFCEVRRDPFLLTNVFTMQRQLNWLGYQHVSSSGSKLFMGWSVVFVNYDDSSTPDGDDHNDDIDDEKYNLYTIPQLKKASSQVTWNTYVAVWSAGCARDCRQSTKCGPFSSYQCHNECCVAGSVSCLRLDGSLNMPVNSACCGLGSLSLLALSVTSLLDNLLNTR